MRDIVEAVMAGRGDWCGVVFGTSFVDVVETCASVAGGPVQVSTAAVGKKDAARVRAIGARLYVCCDLVAMNKAWMGERDLEGIRMHRSHAKCAVFGRGLSVRTSANLTRNYRWESYIVSVCPVVHAGIVGHLAELDRLGSEPWHGEAYYRAVYDAALGGSCGIIDADLASVAERLGA